MKEKRLSDPSVSLATTPIIAGFHPDPTICRVGDRYYLASSSFEYAPAVPVFTSTDLIHWEQIGNALTRPSQFPAGQRGPSQGVFAPTLRHHDQLFWLVTTDNDDAQPDQVLFTASDPAGPWSDPVRVPVVGIDPDLAWDHEGNCYLTWSAPAESTTEIRQVRIDPATGALLEQPRLLWGGTGLAYPEGPHLYERDGWWYLLISEGGTERGHSVAVARSEHITGPFTAAPTNPILSHRSTRHVVQSTGHADLIELGDGRWAMVYLGVRPRGVSPMFHVNGRETFIAGVAWSDGWPVVDESCYIGSPTPTDFDDLFADRALHPRYVSAAAFPADFTRLESTPGVVLLPAPSSSNEQTALSFRPADPYWTSSVEFELTSGRFDFSVRLDDRHRATISVGDGLAGAAVVIGPVETPIGVSSVVPSSGTLTAVIRSAPATFQGPDDIEMALVVDGQETILARFDGRYLSTEVAGGFTGRTVGISAVHERVRVHRFRYQADSPVPTRAVD